MPSAISFEAKTYRAKLNGLLRFGVSPREIKKLLGEARAGDFTWMKAYYLGSWVDAYPDRFDPHAAQEVRRFLRDEGHALARFSPERASSPSGSADPILLPKDQGSTSFVSVNAPLTIDGMDEDDVIQKDLGACWFLASLASMAAAHPEQLAKRIQDNHDGSYRVSFYGRQDAESPVQPYSLKVYPRVPTRNGQPVYATSRSGELWLSLLLRGYAQWREGYENVECGMAGNALFALTGKVPDFIQVNAEQDRNQLFDRLSQLCGEKAVLTAESNAFDTGIPGVVSGHAYSLLGVRIDEQGVQRVRVRNPWGHGEPGSDGKDDGSFELTIEEFARAFNFISYVKLD